MPSVALLCVDECKQEEGKTLAQNLQIPFLDLTQIEASKQFDFVLDLTSDGLSLRDSHIKFDQNKSAGALTVDFQSKQLNYRQQNHSSQELLAKAIGIPGQHHPLVWDVTAGLGQDAWILASLGCEVILFERQPLVYALLQDGLSRAVNAKQEKNSTNAVAARLQLFNRDGISALNDAQMPQPDVVYLDPMFPEKRKNAKAKKAMQYFQALVGKDEDEQLLLAAALKRAKFRVVVKRPLKAPLLSTEVPAAQIKGKTVRFDIYAIQSVQRYLEVKNSQTR